MGRAKFIAFIGAIAIVTAATGPIFAADKIRIAVANFNMAFLPPGIAVKKGFFKDEGLDAEVIRMTGKIAIAAVTFGDVDYTLIFSSVMRAAMRGLPLKRR